MNELVLSSVHWHEILVCIFLATVFSWTMLFFVFVLLVDIRIWMEPKEIEEFMLRDQVLSAVQAATEGNGVSIAELSERLKAKGILFYQDQLQAEVQRLAASERVLITPGDASCGGGRVVAK